MSEEVKKEAEQPWKGDYNWLSRRIDKFEKEIDDVRSEMREQCRDHTRRVRLFVRILVDKKIIGEEVAKSIEESVAKKDTEETNDLIDWVLEETLGIEEAKKFWIAGAIKKKGALRKQLGIKDDEKIPKSILQKIANTEVGKTVSFRGKSIKVTTQLKRRVLLALKLMKMPKRK